MNYFVDNAGKEVLWLHQNLLLKPGGEEVIGVILGQCVFGADGALKGKYLKHSLYDSNGNIIAVESEQVRNTMFSTRSIRESALNILQKIENHISNRIALKSTWNRIPPVELLIG